jgi:hypothetical protein
MNQHLQALVPAGSAALRLQYGRLRVLCADASTSVLCASTAVSPTFVQFDLQGVMNADAADSLHEIAAVARIEITGGGVIEALLVAKFVKDETQTLYRPYVRMKQSGGIGAVLFDSVDAVRLAYVTRTLCNTTLWHRTLKCKF